jgi:hypothetical protein
LRQVGHFNQCVTLGNLVGLMGSSSSLRPDGKAC